MSIDISLEHEDITPEDNLVGSILTGLQIRIIKAKLTSTAHSLINLEPPPDGYEAFIQEHAVLKGAYMALLTLLDESEAATTAAANPGPIPGPVPY